MNNCFCVVLKWAKNIKANEEFPKTNVSKRQAKNARHSLGR